MKNEKRTVNANQFTTFIDLIYNFNKEVKGFNLVTRHGEYYAEIMNINNRDVFVMIPKDEGIPYIMNFDNYLFDILPRIIEDDFNGFITILSLIYKDESKEEEWHDAKEDPPKDSIPVLVTYLGYYDKKPRNDDVAYTINGKWYWRSNDEHVKAEITHWTELPELPKCYKNKG